MQWHARLISSVSHSLARTCVCASRVQRQTAMALLLLREDSVRLSFCLPIRQMDSQAWSVPRWRQIVGYEPSTFLHANTESSSSASRVDRFTPTSWFCLAERSEFGVAAFYGEYVYPREDGASCKSSCTEIFSVKGWEGKHTTDGLGHAWLAMPLTAACGELAGSGMTPPG